MSEVHFRRIGSQEEEFRIPQRGCTYYGGYPDVMTKDNKHGLEHGVPAMSASGGEQTTAACPVLASLERHPASDLPTQHMLYSRSILWHGQQIKLRIMRLDCDWPRKVYVHICSTSKCKS